MVQGEWNTLKMGKSSYATDCKLVRFKAIYIESLESSETVPLMTDGVVNVSKNEFNNLFKTVNRRTWIRCWIILMLILIPTEPLPMMLSEFSVSV